MFLFPFGECAQSTPNRFRFFVFFLLPLFVGVFAPFLVVVGFFFGQGITMHDFQFYDRDALEALQTKEHDYADRKNAIIAEIKVWIVLVHDLYDWYIPGMLYDWYVLYVLHD